MKKMLLIAFSLLLSSAALAAKTAPLQCYGSKDVSQDAPFIVGVSNANDYSLFLFQEELVGDGLIKVEDTLAFGDVKMFVLSVDASQIMTPAVMGFDRNAAINEMVVKRINDLFAKYNFTVKDNETFIQCNGLMTINPRAGGMNPP